MRQLILLRGCPASGKSTFVKENGLEPYTISPDTLRTQYSSPVFDTKGKAVINQENDGKVWKLLFQILEERMKKGEFIVVDATHSTAKLINKYKQLRATYGYRTYVVNFDVPLEVCLKRNALRESHKFVPVEVIENIHERLQHENIPSFAKVIKPEELLKEVQWKAQDFNRFDKLHVIGDVHGCFTALNEFLSDIRKGLPLHQYIQDQQNEAFIFVGDLFDRGIENAKIFQLIEAVYKLDNVFIIEGNHERHLRKYAKTHNDIMEAVNEPSFISENYRKDKIFNEHYRSRGFVETTLKEFIDAGITPERVKPIVKSLLQCLYIKFDEKDYLITHGGILPNMLNKLNFVSTHQLINGVGGYEFDIDGQWTDKYNTIQLHGHRNLYREPLSNQGCSINLEGRVEKGGHLRAITIHPDNSDLPILDDIYELHEIKNEVFDSKWLLSNKHTDKLDKDITITDFINAIGKNNKDIKMKHQYENVYSINFTKKLFQSGKWNQLAVHSRGLFVKQAGDEWKVIGRGYNKFFNIEEMNETKLENMVDTLEFPLTAYDKANGFLGLLFVDDNELIFASKSTTHKSPYNNDYAMEFKRIMEEKFDKEQLEDIKLNLALRNQTAVFEVISPEFDPHIVKYYKDDVILLDLIDNNIHFKKDEYQHVINFAEMFNINYKSIKHMFKNWQEFYQWYKVTKDDLSIKHEGFVFEDSNGFMFKFKTKWYSHWKYMRSLAPQIANGKAAKQFILQGNSELRNFYYWAKRQDKETLSKDIITLRDMFYDAEY